MPKLLLNTTFGVSAEAKDDFLAWAIDMCIPAATSACGCSDILLTRIIPSSTEETDAYALQVRTATPENAQEWLHGPFRMLLEYFYSNHKSEDLLYFITMMEVIA